MLPPLEDSVTSPVQTRSYQNVKSTSLKIDRNIMILLEEIGFYIWTVVYDQIAKSGII